jgi:hypothetical protein
MIVKCQNALQCDINQIAKNQKEKRYLEQYSAMVNARCDHLKSALPEIIGIVL